MATIGCERSTPIRQYSISTEMPSALQSEDRMLGAIIPQPDAVWFFKVVGPAEAIEAAAPQIRDFIEQVPFEAGQPDLESIPADWTRDGERPMRLATLLIPTPHKELELAISQLPKTEDWDQQVAMNVNRWRQQMSLDASEDRWAGAEPLRSEPADEDQPAVWVDLSGQMGAGPSAMASPPFASGNQLPPGHPEIPDTANGSPAAGRQQASGDSPGSAAGNAATEDSGGLKYEAPQQWRAGKMSMMRMAAFEIGPEDRSAELTVIQAGGDVRGNVERWIGQVRGDTPPSDVVDKALQDAERLQVSGRDAQRFYLAADEQDADEGQAIDATLVPLENGMSLFIKATGPATTLAEQRDAIGEFLKSLSLPQ